MDTGMPVLGSHQTPYIVFDDADLVPRHAIYAIVDYRKKK
jgi:hypothetical protein